MGISKEQQALNILQGIKTNMDKIEKANKENKRLFAALERLGTFPLISDEQRKRYDEELASDSWKQFSKRYIEPFKNQE